MQYQDIIQRQERRMKLEKQIQPINLYEDEFEQYNLSFHLPQTTFQRLYSDELSRFNSKIIDVLSATTIDIVQSTQEEKFLKKLKKDQEIHQHYQQHGHCLYNRCYKRSKVSEKPRHLKQ
ncbi:hypothetical protein SS50377_25267 [Spironucleus salmonicida]|uniref:Uncharacterized protein n=1 Tax=Spironucleus salmonicida TaxID=348837 RepID=V6LBP3_9EUKA|nr:hypothetical protein SS50377_25267 [Spironucleus salmonicida]|eukprot:EST41852.1 Hypothetical protein SS50377_18687 [Spironucleus salmonicida]